MIIEKRKMGRYRIKEEGERERGKRKGEKKVEGWMDRWGEERGGK